MKKLLLFGLLLISSCSQTYKILTKYPTTNEINTYEVLDCKKYKIENIESKLKFKEGECIKVKKNKIYSTKCKKCN